MLRLAMITLALAPSFLSAQNTGRITGVVTDASTHQPIPKVHVSCVSGTREGGPGSGQFVGALTGVDGIYTLEDVPAGFIRMTINLDGYKLIADGPDRPDRNSGFPLAAGDTINRSFEMHPLGRIYGRLVDRETGKPIADHTVSAIRKEFQLGQTYQLERASDPKNGEFDILNLEPGDYWIRIDPTEQGKLVFPPDASPKPAPQKCYGHTWYPDVPRIEMAAVIRLGEGENRHLDISLESREMHSLSGTMKAPRESESQPVAFALRGSGNLLNGAVGVMPSPGSFRIDNLAPGSYQLSVTGGKLAGNLRSVVNYVEAMAAEKTPNAVAADYSFEITDSDIDDFKVTLAPYAGVSGEVRMLEKDAKVPNNLAVVMFPASDGPIFIRAVGVESGRFHQDGLRPGEYWPQLKRLPEGFAVAQVVFEGASPRNSTMTLSGPDAQLTFVVTSRPGTIAGVVRNDDQSPVGDALVILLPDPLPNKPSAETLQAKQTPDKGGFLFRNLAPGKYKLLVLTGATIPRQGDFEYLRAQAASADTIEVLAGQSVTVNLKP
jgi:hypothetical protein